MTQPSDLTEQVRVTIFNPTRKMMSLWIGTWMKGTRDLEKGALMMMKIAFLVGGHLSVGMKRNYERCRNRMMNKTGFLMRRVEAMIAIMILETTNQAPVSMERTEIIEITETNMEKKKILAIVEVVEATKTKRPEKMSLVIMQVTEANKMNLEENGRAKNLATEKAVGGIKKNLRGTKK